MALTVPFCIVIRPYHSGRMNPFLFWKGDSM